MNMNMNICIINNFIEEKKHILQMLTTITVKMYHAGVAEKTAKHLPNMSIESVQECKDQIEELQNARQRVHTQACASLKGLE